MTAETSPPPIGDVTEPRPRSGGWMLVLLAIVGAEFMLQLDGTIVNVALPNLQRHMGLSVASASWVPNSFLLAFGGMLLTGGRLGDVLGHRRVFMGGVGLVALASLLAGLAPDFAVLLTGRILQGAGAALAGPAGLALLATAIGEDRRQRAFGLYSTVTGLGASAGMVLGGVLTWAGDWRWSLLVNAPVGAIIILVALRALPAADAPRSSRSLALPSAVLVTAAVTAGVLGLAHAANGGWGTVATIVPLVVAVVLFAVLFAVDSRMPEPLLPREIFASRDRAGSFLVLLLLAMVLTGLQLYLVQYLQRVLNFDPLQAGLALLPFGLALLASTQLLTPRIAKVDMKARAIGGLVLVGAGFGWLSQLTGHSGYYADVLGPIVVLGFGVGIAIIPFNMLVLTTAPPEHAGVTAGVLQTTLTIGGSVGLAILLIPFTQGSGDIAVNTSTVFIWSALAMALALIVAITSWYLIVPRGDPARPER